MKHVIIIGGGVAGMQCASTLADNVIRSTIIDKEADLGGKIRSWHVLPNIHACK